MISSPSESLNIHIESSTNYRLNVILPNNMYMPIILYELITYKNLYGSSYYIYPYRPIVNLSLIYIYVTLKWVYLYEIQSYHILWQWKHARRHKVCCVWIGRVNVKIRFSGVYIGLYENHHRGPQVIGYWTTFGVGTHTFLKGLDM